MIPCDLQVVVVALDVVLQLEGGDVEPDLLAGWSPDDPGAVLGVGVVGGVARRTDHPRRREVVAAAD